MVYPFQRKQGVSLQPSKAHFAHYRSPLRGQTLGPNETLYGFQSAINPFDAKMLKAVARRAADKPDNDKPILRGDQPVLQVGKRPQVLAAETPPSLMEVTSNSSKGKKVESSSHYKSIPHSNHHSVRRPSKSKSEYETL